MGVSSQRSVLPQNHVSPQCVFPQGVSVLGHFLPIGGVLLSGSVPLKACPPTGACPPSGVCPPHGGMSSLQGCILRIIPPSGSCSFLPQGVSASHRACPPSVYVLLSEVCPPSEFFQLQSLSSLRVCPFFRGVFSPQGHVLPQDGVLSLEACSLPEGPLLPGLCSPFRSTVSPHLLFRSTVSPHLPRTPPLPKHPHAHLSRSSGVPLGSFIASKYPSKAWASVSTSSVSSAKALWNGGIRRRMVASRCSNWRRP